MLIDGAGRLFAVGHGVGNVGGSGDEIAASEEAGATGFEGEAVDINGAVLFEAQAGGTSEIEVNAFANGEDDGVAIEALNFVGEDGLPATRGVIFAETGFDNFDGFDMAGSVANHAVWSGEEDELCAFLSGGASLLFNGRHVFPFAAIEDGDVGAFAKRTASGIDGGITATDDGDFAANIDGLRPWRSLPGR